MNRLSTRAIIIGGLAGVLASGLLGFTLDAAMMARLGLLHSSSPHAHTVAATSMRQVMGVQALWVGIGLLGPVLGGYVAARFAGHDELWNGAASSALYLVMDALTLASGRESRSVPVHIALLVVSPVCGLVGAYLQQLRQHRSTPPQPM